MDTLLEWINSISGGGASGGGGGSWGGSVTPQAASTSKTQVVGQTVSSPTVPVGSIINSQGKVVGTQGQITPQAASTTTPAQSNGGGSSGGGGGGGGGYTADQALKMGLDVNQLRSQGKLIDDAAGAQNNAAAAAAEAARQAAQRRYQANVDAANKSKENAGLTYNWLVDTLGSNKKDTLNQITTNTNMSLDAYEKNKTDTQGKYDGARQEILSTYRDLNLQQGKILRGSGQAQSSRSQEAQLRLNNLMGKDLSTLSTQNADAMAVIGNAIAAVKQKASDLSNSVETQTKQQLDKAAIEYKAQVDAINSNLQLADNARQDAFDAATAKLESDKANILNWATGLKLQAAQLGSQMKGQLDGFILDNTNEQGALTTNLTAAQSNLQKLVQGISNVQLQKGTTEADPNTAQYQKSTVTLDDLKKALESGALTPDQYQQQAAAITSSPSLAGGPTVNGNSATSGVQRDPLLAALFNRAGGLA